MTDETKAKISAACKGRKAWNKGLKGEYLHSAETKKKISEAGKGRHISDKQKKQISEVHKGKTVSIETKQKQSLARKKWWSGLSADERREFMEPCIKSGQEIKISSIEIAICRVLDKLGIKYETQKEFCSGKFIADIYVRSKNTIIECNGDYWHNLESRKIRDKQFQKYCSLEGIKLVWLWEHDINIDPLNALRCGVKNV